MARVIALVGSKGGSGKSTAAHMLAHGAGSLARPIPCVVLTTDPHERPREDPRRYLVRDARTQAQLVAELDQLLQVDRLLVVLDGAAARPELDAIVADVADLAVLPVKPGAHDIQRALDDLARIPKAVALPMDWPRHRGVAARANRWLAAIPADVRLPPFHHQAKLDGLLSADGYAAAAYDLASPARGLVLEILARAGIDPDELTGGKAP